MHNSGCPRKVGFVVGKMVGGGVESVIINILKNIDKRKYDVDLIIDSDSTIVPFDEIKKMGVGIQIVHPYQNIIVYLKDLYKLFKKERYTIIHSNISSLNVFPLSIAYFAHVPIRIAHNHNLIAPDDSRIKNMLKGLFSKFNTIFANSLVAPTFVSGEWVFNNNKFHIIPNGIDSAKFRYVYSVRSKVRKNLNINEDTFLIGSFGRIVESKRLDFALKVFKKISSNNPNTKFLIIGSGPKSEELHNLIDSDIILKDNVIFLNGRNDIGDYYSALDAYIFPSSSEAFGMAAVEAQVNGLVTVLSENIPQETKISNNLFVRMTGYDVNLWAKEIENIMSKDYDREKISNKLVNENPLDAKEMTLRVEQLYEEAIMDYEK